MKLVVSSICISSLLLFKLSIFPQATAQCLTRNDDTSRISTNIDLSNIQDFHFQLFRELIPGDVKKNFIFSPYSIWSALTLAYFGASGRTEEQLLRVLRHTDKVSALNNWRAVEYVYNRRQKDSIGSTFISANRAYFDTRIRLKPCIQDLLRNEVERIDFTKPQEASDHINGFVSQTTKGNIKDLVTSDTVDRARLVLVNAAYFKGVWEKTFNKRNTMPDTFTGLDGRKYSVDMMQQKGMFRFGYDDQLKAKFLELPYTGKSSSMIIFLPYKNTQENFIAMIQGLSNRKFEEVIDRMILADIDVHLPKFKMDTTIGDELLQTLASMGISDAFDSRKADFTTFSQDRQLNLDKSIQKAFIDVNEEGTEAAAATGFVGTKSGGSSSFECNRPFIFVIRDIDTKNILFMGSYKSSDKIDQSYEPTGEPNRNNNFPVRDKIAPNSFSPNPVYSGQFFPTTNIENHNPNPLPIPNIPLQGGIRDDFSHGHQSSSHDRIFSTLGQSSGFPPAKSQDRNLPTFGENSGSNSGNQKNNQGVLQTVLPSSGNSGSLPSRGSNQNFEQTFNHVSPGSSQNIQSQREDFIPIPYRGVAPSPHQNIPAIPNSYQSSHNGGSIVQRPERDYSGFQSDKVVTQSINQNNPSSEGNYQNYQSNSGNRVSQYPDQTFIHFEENGRIATTQSSVRNTHLLKENVPSFKENNGLIPDKVLTQNSSQTRPPLKENSDFIPGKEIPQTPERNIPSFGNNRGDNQSPNHNIPTFEFTGQVISHEGSFLRPNQYIYPLGVFTPVIVRPQNSNPTLFGHNLGRNLVGYSGLIPDKGQNGPSFGGNNGYSVPFRGASQFPNQYTSFT